MPLFLFHLLEFTDVDWELDLKEIQSRWDDFDQWSQLVLKQTTDEVELITEAPSSGLWRMDDDGSVRFVRQEIDWHAVSRDNEAFYLRVYGAGEYRYPGADVGVVVTRGRMQTDDRELLDRGRLWAEGLVKVFRGVPPESVVVPREQLPQNSICSTSEGRTVRFAGVLTRKVEQFVGNPAHCGRCCARDRAA